MADKIFPKGVYFSKKEGAPDFVIGSLSIKVPEAIPFLQQYQNNAGFVNIDILIGKESGKPFCSLNQYVKQQTNEQNLNNFVPTTTVTYEKVIEYPEDDINSEDIPF